MALTLCVYLCVHAGADGEEFVSVLTELLFELHIAATPDKLNKVWLQSFLLMQLSISLYLRGKYLTLYSRNTGFFFAKHKELAVIQLTALQYLAGIQSEYVQLKLIFSFAHIFLNGQVHVVLRLSKSFIFIFVHIKSYWSNPFSSAC